MLSSLLLKIQTKELCNLKYRENNPIKYLAVELCMLFKLISYLGFCLVTSKTW
jgi:hypothetical protein